MAYSLKEYRAGNLIASNFRTLSQLLYIRIYKELIIVWPISNLATLKNWKFNLVIILVRINVRPEKRKELSQTLQSIVGQVRKESGCLHAGCYQVVESETEFLVVEEWATQQDSEDHLRSDIFTVLMGAGSLMHRPPEIVVHQTVSRSDELEA